jgi:hypothetical protein
VHSIEANAGNDTCDKKKLLFRQKKSLMALVFFTHLFGEGDFFCFFFDYYVVLFVTALCLVCPH